MTTQPRNTLSPQKNSIPPRDASQTIVKQVTTPYLNQQTTVPSTPYLLPTSSLYQRVSGPPSSKITTQELQRGSGVPAKQVEQVIKSARQSRLYIPPPTRRVEYVPYEQKYIEYVQQKVQVPVQRHCTDYYSVQHIIEYVPIQKEDIVYETQPKQVVTMKLQYVPVEQKIIHISEKNAKALGITEFVSTDAPYGKFPSAPSGLYQPIPKNSNLKPEQPQEAKSVRRSRTNFVTSDGYDPEANIRQIDRLLTASSVSASRVNISG